MIDIYLEIYIKSFETMPTLHQVNEQGSLIHLRQCLPRSVQRDQGVSNILARAGSSVSRKSFLLYVRAMDHYLGALLAQNNNQKHEHVIYYLNRTMIRTEHRYNPIEKECLA